MIYTTAEVVLLAFDESAYQREFAEDSGYEELVVYHFANTKGATVTKKKRLSRF